MTKFRALLGALATGTLILAFAQFVNAASTENDISGLNSKVDGACVAPLPFFNGIDCSYNASDPVGEALMNPSPNGWSGPTSSASYYQTGDSPFAQCNCDTDTPVPGDPLKTELAITGTITIEDMDDGVCDTTDTLAGSIELAAGTRAFAGGPGEQGEESWGVGDIVFPIPETTVDTATPNASTGGCDYLIIRDDMGAPLSFPPLLQQAGTSNLYPVDASVDAAGFYDAPSPVGVACVTEKACGVAVDVTVGPGWSCTDNTGGTGACELGAAGGAHFGGANGTLENWLISVSTDGGGDITSATIFANGESKVFSVLPDPYNSWAGSLMTFSGICNNCSLVRDDNYSYVEGSGTVALDIGANDAISGNTTITITGLPDQGGTADPVNNNGGPAQAITVDYVGVAAAGTTETFVYTADNGTDNVAATVTVSIVADTVPVANDVTRTLDTEGVDPSTLTDSFNGLTEGGNDAGNNGVVTVGAAGSGTSGTDGTNVTYSPGATFFSGTDTFTYTITDDQSDSDDGVVTINIPDVDPTVDDAVAETDQGVAVTVPISFDAGNGSAAQHTAAAVAGNGTCTVDLGTAMATYTPDAEFAGDDTCTVTLTDGDGSSDDGVITITVNEDDDLVIKFPGGSALDPWTLALLIGLPLLRRRRVR